MNTKMQSVKDAAIADTMKKARTFFETRLDTIADPANWLAQIKRFDKDTVFIAVLPQTPGPGLQWELDQFLSEHVEHLEYAYGPINIYDAVPAFINSAFDFYREICSMDGRESIHMMQHLARFDNKGEMARLALGHWRIQKIPSPCP